ncbi:hypothetical protein [Vibrio sp. F74]|uniref:hypothetical protein n=1 Tax=Vibrio sp. F74 TaxID=700020 RepID=UPI0035F56C22
MIFHKAYKTGDFEINDTDLNIRKKNYTLHRIIQVEARKLGLRGNLINVICLALVLSAVTWAFVPQFGFIAFIVALFFSLFSWRNYELRALFRGTDEAGDYWVCLASCRTAQEFDVIKSIREELTHLLNLN